MKDFKIFFTVDSKFNILFILAVERSQVIEVYRNRDIDSM